MEDGKTHMKEVYRFPNGVHTENGHLVWDVEAILREVKTGIQTTGNYPGRARTPEEYCRVCGKPADGLWFREIEKYEAEVLSKRR